MDVFHDVHEAIPGMEQMAQVCAGILMMFILQSTHIQKTAHTIFRSSLAIMASTDNWLQTFLNTFTLVSAFWSMIFGSIYVHKFKEIYRIHKVVKWTMVCAFYFISNTHDIDLLVGCGKDGDVISLRYIQSIVTYMLV